jgi:tRNA threonylcarbamoyladenosine biosynthesis protein TsaB
VSILLPDQAPKAPTLLIDAATEQCIVALAWSVAPRATAVDAEIEQVGNRHSERVLALVDAVLARQGVPAAACGGFGFGAGPGSFTGLRVACGVVQGFGLGCGRPVVGVGNLRALALAAGGAGGSSLVAIDAKMGQLYWAVYGAVDRGAVDRGAVDRGAVDRGAVDRPLGLAAPPRELAPPALAERADLARLLATWRPAHLVAGPEVADAAGTGLSPEWVPMWPTPAQIAVALATIAHHEIQGGRGIGAADAAPVYVRDRVAATIEDRRVAALRS